MDNFFSNLQQGQMQTQTYTGGIIAGNMTGVSALQRDVSVAMSILDMKAGDTFQGEILSVNGEEVQILLANKQLLQARLEGQIQLSSGQQLSFQIKSNKDSHIVLKPIYDGIEQQQVGVAALKAAHLPVNDKNLLLVSKMIEGGMPIDKNSLMSIHRQVLQHPQDNIESIMKLIKLQIPVTENNIDQYEHYSNLEHKLLDGIKTVSQDVVNMYDDIPKEKADIFINEVINMIADEQDNMVLSDRLSAIIQKGDENTSADMNVTTEIPQVFQQALDEGNINLKTVQYLLSPESPISENEIKIIKDSLFKSSSFKELLSKGLQDRWTLTPEEIFQPDKIQEFYRKLSQESARLAKLMDESVISENTGKENPGRNAQNIHDNVDFMNQMNHIFQYVQLPLKLSEKNAHGELYVYANKKHLARKDGTLTALLHLDMDNLGKMDINISLNTENNQVSTRFYLQEEYISFLQEHMKELIQRLEQKGYHTKVYVSKLEKDTTVVEQIEKQVPGIMTPLSYQAFDMRT